MSVPDDKLLGEQGSKSVWVVFSGKADCLWLKCLKPGFRHCFALINDGQRWLSFDPMLHYTDVQMHHHIPPAFDLPAWFEARGYTVLKAPDGTKPQKPAPLSLFSCVECVKRLLGLHCRLIFTPWQLYSHLLRQQNHKEKYHGKSGICSENFDNAATATTSALCHRAQACTGKQRFKRKFFKHAVHK